MKMLLISQIMEKMIAFSEGNIHDIDHFVGFGIMQKQSPNWKVLILILNIF